MAITNATTIPKIVAAQLLVALRRSQVFGARVNNAYRGLLRDGGNEITINVPAAATISDYTVNGTVTYANADVGTPITIGLDKQKSWAIKFDDINAALSRPNVLAASVVEHGVRLAEVGDEDVRAAMNTGATDGPAITVDHDASAASIGDLGLSALHRRMDLNNIPRAGRWLILGPYFAEFMQKVALENETLLSSGATQALVNGSIGRFAGFDMYVAPGNYSTFNSGQKRATETLFYGVDSATAFIDQVNRTEQLRLQTTFADAVRGLYSYGYKVISPERIFKSAGTVNNVPA